MDRVQSFGRVRDVSADDRLVTAVISTDSVARDGAVIRQDGWDLSQYTGTVLWSHDDAGLPVGRMVDYQLGEHELVATTRFNTRQQSLELLELIRVGDINATSVRWLPIDYGVEKLDGRDVLVFRRQELLEYSFVNVPADPLALVQRGHALDPRDFMTVPVPAPPRRFSIVVPQLQLERIDRALERLGTQGV